MSFTRLFFCSLPSVLCFLFSAFCSSSFADESITLTTYYPAPFGVYNTVRFFPHSAPATCQSGEVYYNNSTNQLMVCKSGSWVTVGSVIQLNQGTGITLNPNPITTTGMISNSGVLSVAGGNGITASPTTGNVALTNTGVLRVTAGGIGISASPQFGNVVISNTGVTSMSAVSPISISAPTGSVTVRCPGCLTSFGPNLGVTQIIAGTGVTISPSSGKGAVTVNAGGSSGASITRSGCSCVNMRNFTGDVYCPGNQVNAGVCGNGQDGRHNGMLCCSLGIS